MSRPRPHTRRAFTLIELVIAIALTGIVAMGLMSALLLSIRAIPSESDEGVLTTRLDSAYEFLLADILVASDVIVDEGGERLTLQIPNPSGAGTQLVRFRATQGTLGRRIEGKDWRVLAENISSVIFTAHSSNSRAVSVSVSVVTSSGTTHRSSFECLARPEQ